MTVYAVRDLLGIGPIPRDRTAASAWLKRHGVPVSRKVGRGGRADVVSLPDLPLDVSQAILSCRIRDGELLSGTFDEEAHATIIDAPPSMREAAMHKAALATFLLTEAAHVAWPEKVRMVQARFGAKGNTRRTLMRILDTVAGVDPINFAPALLSGYRSASVALDVDPAAWRMFLSTIERAAPTYPLKAAWRDVRDVSAERGSSWPSYPTIYRRWIAMGETDRRALRHGREEAARSMTQPALRDKTTIGPLEWVSQDGRTLDFWVDWGDGRPSRPTMLVLVDVASNKVLDYELARSENAVSTVRMIRRTCQTHGIIDRLYTDNGSAFAGHLVAGGAPHRFRNAGKGGDVAPLGICHHLGIALHFALPRNAQAKIAERTYAALSRAIDDRPEFRGAHAGHAPGASPTAHVVPVPIALAEEIIRREVDRHNREPGRRSQGANGRSYEAVFEAGLKDRITRVPSSRQLYLAGLIYTPASVDRDGRVKIDGWTYGGPETQDKLLRYHGKGQILVGRNPDDLNAPALAFNADRRLICEGIEPVRRGAYGSTDGIRDAARNRKAARAAVDAATRAHDTMSDAEMDAAWADLTKASAAKSSPDGPERDRRVVAARFGAPVQSGPNVAPARRAEPFELPAIYQDRLDRHLAEAMTRSAEEGA